MNELEVKKLKEASNIKVKRIAHLEAQLDTAKKMIVDCECKSDKSPPEVTLSQPIIEQQMKITSLESRILFLEQKISSLNMIESVRSHNPVPTNLIYMCHECNYESTDKDTLRSHVTDKHTEQFHCTECDFVTLYSTELNAHVDQYHY